MMAEQRLSPLGYYEKWLNILCDSRITPGGHPGAAVIAEQALINIGVIVLSDQPISAAMRQCATEDAEFEKILIAVKTK